MAFYKNNTRHASIVTIQIVAVNDPKTAVKIGVSELLTLQPAELGYNDLVVPAGEHIELADGTTANFISSRSGE